MFCFVALPCRAVRPGAGRRLFGRTDESSVGRERGPPYSNYPSMTDVIDASQRQRLSPKSSHDELNFARPRRPRDSFSVPLGAAIASKLRLREIHFRSNQERTDHTVPVLHCPDDAKRKVLTSDTYSRSLSTPADIAAIDSAGGKGRRRETRACHGQTQLLGAVTLRIYVQGLCTGEGSRFSGDAVY